MMQSLSRLRNGAPATRLAQRVSRFAEVAQLRFGEIPSE